MNALEQILTMTEATPTGPDRWMGHCLAHGSKRHRELSIKLTSERILLYCFAGCLKPAICRSLDLELKDLFTDALDPDPRRRREAAQQRDHQRQQREQQTNQKGALIDALREADYFVRSRRGLDISGWNDQKLNDELNALADAYHLLEREALDG